MLMKKRQPFQGLAENSFYRLGRIPYLTWPLGPSFGKFQNHLIDRRAHGFEG